MPILIFLERDCPTSVFGFGDGASLPCVWFKVQRERIIVLIPLGNPVKQGRYISLPRHLLRSSIAPCISPCASSLAYHFHPHSPLTLTAPMATAQLQPDALSLGPPSMVHFFPPCLPWQPCHKERGVTPMLAHALS